MLGNDGEDGLADGQGGHGDPAEFVGGVTDATGDALRIAPDGPGHPQDDDETAAADMSARPKTTPPDIVARV